MENASVTDTFNDKTLSNTDTKADTLRAIEESAKAFEASRSRRTFLETLEKPSKDYDEELEQSIMKGIKSSCYSEGDLSSLLNDLRNIDGNMSYLRTFALKNSQMMRRVNWMNDIQRPNSLRHLYGLISFAEEMMNEGWEVRLIEGTNSRGVRLVSDLDLLLTKSDDIWLVDFKLSLKNDTKGTAALDSIFEKLSVTTSLETRNVDLRFDKDIEVENLVSDTFEESMMRIAEFNKVMNDWSSDDLTEVLDEYTKLIEVKSSPLRSYNKHKDYFKHNRARLGDCLKRNGYESMETFENFMSLPGLDENYCKSHFDDLNSQKLKAVSYIPLMAAGPDDIDECIRSLSNSDLLCKLLKEAWFNGESSCSDYSIERVVIDGVKMNSVLISDGCVEYLKRDKHFLTASESERRLSVIEQDMMKPCSSNHIYYEDITNLSESIGSDSKLDEWTREHIRRTMNKINSTKLTDWILGHHLVSTAVSNGYKKHYKVKDVKTRRNMSMFSVDNIKGKKCVVISSLNGGLATVKDKKCCILGDLIPIDPLLSETHTCNRTKWFNISGSDQDWWTEVYHKHLSWSSMVLGVQQVTKRDSSLNAFSSLLMMVNNSKFAQFSELMRYVFVNSTGMAKGVKGLYDKFKWYIKPFSSTGKNNYKCLVQKVFCNRMIKLGSVVELFSVNRAKQDILMVSRSSVTVPESLGRNSSWNLAFPHEKSCIPTDMNSFNSIYTCKMLTTCRNQKILSESLVFLKELESNLDFQRLGQKTFPVIESVQDLLNIIAPHEASKFDVDWPTVICGSLSTLKRAFEANRKAETVGDLRKLMTSQTILMDLSLSDLTSTKGSVNYCESGISVTKRTLEENKTVMKTQNDPLYNTMLLCQKRVHKGMRIRRRSTYQELKERQFLTEAKEILSKEDLKFLSTKSDSVIPTLLYILENDMQMVTKMVHKDQIGPREISVMNFYLRVVSYIIENYARNVQKTLLDWESTGNIIECADKSTRIEKYYRKSESMRKNKTMNLFFDNADCSTWGPSMMSSCMHFSVSNKVSLGTDQKVLKSMWGAFSNKIFKIPDELYLHSKGKSDVQWKEGSENSVLEAVHKMQNMDSKTGVYKGQFLFAPQGMSQGLTQVSSGVFGDDNLNLQKFVMESKFSYISLTMDHLNTSDDYNRVFVYNNEDGLHDVFDLIPKISWLTDYIARGAGITRNEKKSVYHERTCELNSEFRTGNGVHIPDKARISYVQVPTFNDFASNSQDCINKGLDYLRNSGSYIGACIIVILRQHLSLLQCRNIELLRDKTLFTRPPEYGGMIRCNLLVQSSMPSFCWAKENYGLEGSEECFSYLTSTSPLTIEATNSGLFTLSRSGITNISCKPERRHRAITEVLSEIDDEDYLPIMFRGFKRSILSVLMKCSTQELSKGSGKSACLRFIIPQSPKTAVVYRTRVRGEVMTLTRPDLFKMKKMEVRDVLIPPLSYSNLDRDEKLIKNCIRSVKPLGDDTTFKVVPISRRDFKHGNMTKYISEGAINESTKTYASLNMPDFLGGNKQNKSYNFLTNLDLVRQRLRKASYVQGNYPVTVLSNEVSLLLPEVLLKSNFLEGSRLEYSMDSGFQKSVEPSTYILRCLDVLEPGIGGKKGKFLDPTNSFHRSRIKSDSNIDITSIVNSLTSNGPMSKLDACEAIVKLADKGSIYNISKSDLIISRDTLKHKTFSDGTIIMEPLMNNSSSIIGTHMSKMSKKKWTHYLSEFDGECGSMVQNKNDEYIKQTFLDSRNIRVRLRPVHGVITLSYNKRSENGYEDHPIMILCSDVPRKVGSLVLKMSRHHSLMCERSEEILGTTSDLFSYNPFSKHVPMVREPFEAQEMCMENIFDSDSDDDLDFLNLSDSSSEASGDSSELDSESDESVNMEIAESSVISSTTDHRKALYSLSANSVNLSFEGKTKVYTIDLPIAGKYEFSSHDDSALYQFLELINTKDELESMWMRAYLRSVFMNYGETRAYFDY